MVNPIFYNIVLKLQEGTMLIEEIIGANNTKYTEHLKKYGEISKTHTIFGSNEFVSYWEKATQGAGILIIKLKPRGIDKSTMQCTVTVSYEDREECDYSNSKSILFDHLDDEYFDSTGMRKGILLCHYTKLLMEWIRDTKSLDGN